MKQASFAVILIMMLTGLLAISYSDAEFCLHKELWPVLDKHAAAIRDSALVSPASQGWQKLYMQYAAEKSDTLAVLTCLEQLALQHDDFPSAMEWLNTASLWTLAHPEFPYQVTADKLTLHFTKDADHFILSAFQNGAQQDSLYSGISRLNSTNLYIEDLAKALLDMISVETNDTISFALTDRFYQTFKHSKWSQAVYYFELAHYIYKQDYPATFDLIDEKSKLSPAHSYLTTLFLTSPTWRRELDKTEFHMDLLQKALDIINAIPAVADTQLVLYDYYSPPHWQARLKLQKAKILYYQILQTMHLYGDEDSLLAVLPRSNSAWKEINTLLNSISFTDNDTGEQAELAFWKGKLYALRKDSASLKAAAGYFAQSLISGSPRKKYDTEAHLFSNAILVKLDIKTNLLAWQRKTLKYDGITFDDITTKAGFIANREARVAAGDFNNDGLTDILLSGRRLYQNNGNLKFTEVTDTMGLGHLNASGGLFADFNLDGKLDFMTISSAEDGSGESLMKNQGDRFARVNERAGDIDDQVPTEGAAWIDCFHDSYPDLYCANYEKWNVRSGYEDKFWTNEKGYFSDKTKAYGFLEPYYSTNPGQAGRGVAPADFDNDGDQEIFVTNYRLDRNFMWDRQDTTFTDIAALDGLQGILKQGYYGHSIGADWGDFDNDGDLDLFVANLAHPRYIDISDISMLLRNDGEMYCVIEGDTIRYWQFTNVTRQAGITYDELHSDPLWFDADNDGLLDLFITCVYENERSYLYHNNGDGTFSDITWLAGARVYNGWGNACADFDHDSRLDLLVGSGSGMALLHNTTVNKNAALFIKPVWQDGKVALIKTYKNYREYPNSPAYGTRIMLTMQTPRGKSIHLIRELSSAKGTTSQSEPVLHFGLGRNLILRYDIFHPEITKP